VAADGTFARSASITGPDRLLAVPASRSRVYTSGVGASLCAGVAFADAGSTPNACGLGVVGEYSGHDTAWLGPLFNFVSDLPGRTALRIEWSQAGRALVGLSSPRDLSRVSRVSARVILDPSSTGAVRLALRDSRGRVAIARSFGNPVEPVTGTGSDLRLWPQQIWAPRSAFRGVDLGKITAVGLATEGTGRAWLIDASSRGARPAPRAAVLPTANLRDAQESVPPGQTTLVPYRVTLDRPAPRGARIRVWMDGSAAIPAVNETAIVPPGGRSATVQVEVNASGDFVADSLYPWIYTTRGATVGKWNAAFTVAASTMGAGSVPRLVNRSPVASTEPGGRFVWRLSPRNASGPISAEVRAISSSLDFSDLDPAFRRIHGLPESGPIGADQPLVLESRRTPSGEYRITLPLAANAREGASIDLAFTGIDGAVGAGAGHLSGLVVGR
ncbi:MAG: hypothetical protein ACKOBH_06355, partial [bacterium]